MPVGTAAHVLVVDDEQPLARLVGDYLTKDGFAVTLAFDGADALRVARELSPEVVVLDLGLPGLDGVEVCRRLRTFSRRQLIDAVWGDGWFGDEHLVDVHIGHLRRKLRDDAETGQFIRTVRGVGYRMGEGQ